MYYSDTPANIISTNSMFILNEHFDGKTTQVGGTIPFPILSDETFRDGRYDTYLYLKTFEKNENGEYQKDSTIAWFNVWLNGYEFGGCNETN